MYSSMYEGAVCVPRSLLQKHNAAGASLNMNLTPYQARAALRVQRQEVGLNESYLWRRPGQGMITCPWFRWSDLQGLLEAVLM